MQCRTLWWITSTTWKTELTFDRVSDSHSLYCFIFPQHPTFSCPKMSSFTLLPFKERFVSQQEIGTCNHQEHYALERIFHSPASILDLYQTLTTWHHQQGQAAEFEDERSEVFDSATNYHEADWTKRLHYALTRDFAWMSAQLTMNEGTSFKHPHSGLADKWSSCYGSSHFHFFHDLTLHVPMLTIPMNHLKQKSTPLHLTKLLK